MTIRILVDFDLCTGHGRCYNTSPDLLTEDEEGFVSTRWEPTTAADDRLGEAERAAAACPERAIRVEQD